MLQVIPIFHEFSMKKNEPKEYSKEKNKNVSLDFDSILNKETEKLKGKK